MFLSQEEYDELCQRNGHLTDAERRQIMKYRITPYAGLRWFGIDAFLCTWLWYGRNLLSSSPKLSDIWAD